MSFAPVISRDHLLFRVNFTVTVAVLCLWVIVLKDPDQTTWLLQRVFFIGGAYGFFLSPLIAGFGVSRAVYGRARWFVLLLVLAIGGQGLFGDWEMAVLFIFACTLATIFASFPRVFGLLSIYFAVTAISNGVWPGLGDILDGIVPFLTFADPVTDIVLALVLGALPFVTKFAVDRF